MDETRGEGRAWWVREPWYETFHDLMPLRIQEILVVSSPYDAFILEEDGRLTERIFSEFSELNLSTAPRITHVATARRALELMSERRFDLIATMVRIADREVAEFAAEVKRAWPAMPVVLLVLAEADLSVFPGGTVPDSIDQVFWWTGDARLLLAIVKCVEDQRNVAHDTAMAGVRVIVVVEDSVRHASSFLSHLYAELMTQSASLVAEGLNDLHRLLRMRARPKLLLARNFEEAAAAIDRYGDYLVALITDVRLPKRKGGEEDPSAGFELGTRARRIDPDLPILIHSAEPENRDRAAEMNAHYLDKNAGDLLRQLRAFVSESLGFGDFVFRLPDRTEVARARNLFELEETLKVLPPESVAFHAARNHFSLWLMARCAFGPAKEVRPKSVEEAGGVEALRGEILSVLKHAREARQLGTIADVAARAPLPSSPFVRVGSGSIGGKARGLAFVNAMLARNGLRHRFPELEIRIPRSLVIPTDEYNRFLEGLPLSEPVLANLRRALGSFTGPLAIRSSSLLEDSRLLPFAGIYATYMLPNNHPDPEVRFGEVVRAVRAVFASTHSPEARAYLASTPFSMEEERMAVLIQEVVGRRYGDRFYPTLSGVAVSYNYYPFAPQRAEDGLATIALGLGQTIVQGGEALSFSPAHPRLYPQFASVDDYLRHTQNRFVALDLSHPIPDFSSGPEGSLRHFGLDVAEEDGPLRHVGSSYQPEDETIHDTLRGPGVRLATFHSILKWNSIPLAPALRELLELFRIGFGCPIEMEFALEITEGGTPPSVLSVLQVRPQTTPSLEARLRADAFRPEEILCQTERSLGHGSIDDLSDILYISPERMEPGETSRVAETVGALNQRLMREGRHYLLIGPGRWGTSDPSLGVPVRWSQISNAKVIVETRLGERLLEPSQGAHFFHNVTSFRLGYLMLGNGIDRAWLESRSETHRENGVSHIRLETPLRVYLDGRAGRAVVLKPRSPGTA